MNVTPLIIVRNPCRQGGAALVTSLLFLLILTLTSVTAMMLSTLEERMSGNLRDRNLAFQAAESALRQGEVFLNQSLDANAAGAFNCVAPSTCPVVGDLNAAGAWVVDGVAVFSYATALPHVANQPLFRIEVLTATPVLPLPNDSGGAPSYDNSPPCRYRITARATGARASTVAIVQSTFAHRPISINNQGACHG